MLKRLVGVGVLLLVCSVVGCGGGPKLVSVDGQLTYNGQPLGDVNLAFYPSAGEGTMGSAAVDATGKFSAECASGKGLTAGTYKVTVAPANPAPEDNANTDASAYDVKEEALPYPIKYRTQEMTDATITVPDGGVKDLKIDLKD